MSGPVLAFGPVPSRRLGRSLGVNNIPPKICTYSCVYCQLGPTRDEWLRRQAFYDPEEIVAAVRARLAAGEGQGQGADYLTLVPDGEPTLDVNLGRAITALQALGLPVAVLTNASLLWLEEVREDLAWADWVSLKVDTVTEAVWKAVNRPHGHLRLEVVLGGMQAFAAEYEGELVTETMLVRGVNDEEGHLERVARFLGELDPSVAYLAVPTRPPAETWVEAAPDRVRNHAYRLLQERVERVECLFTPEEGPFACPGDLEEEVLAITAVHPLREESLRELVARKGESWEAVERLVEEGALVAVRHEGERFYRRGKPMPAR